MKKLLIIFLITWAFTASAVEIQTIQLKPTLWEKIITCKWHISCYKQYQQKFSSTIVTISGSDTVKDALKTTVNNNFTALNTGKFELSDWYATTSAKQLTTLSGLVSIGTITTGTWNASTLTVSYGGTGSTTLSANQVLLGNGTTMLKTVSGFGTSGQFLTSAGAGAVPSWTTAAVNEAGTYSWTGLHTFSTATTTFNATTSIAATANTAPLRLNGINYGFPSTEGASSTVLSTNGSGALSWVYENPRVLLSDGTIYTSTGATTTVSLTIPAGTIGEDDSLEIIMITDTTAGSGVDSADIGIGTGAATTTLAVSSGTGGEYRFKITLFNNDSVSAQTYVVEKIINVTETHVSPANATINTGNNFFIAFGVATAGGGRTLSIVGIRVLHYRK